MVKRRQLRSLTPLSMAARDGRIDIMRALIDAGANLKEESNPYGDKALHHCRSVEAMQLLIDKGAEVKQVNKWGLTPLHIVAWEGSSSLVRTLLASGASVSSTTNDHETPLHFAAFSHRSTEEKSEVMDILLSAGADVNAVDRNNNTPLCVTTSWDTVTMMQLLKAGSNITAGNKCLKNVISSIDNNDPSHLEVIRWLLGNGVDVNHGNNVELRMEPVPQLVGQKIFGPLNLEAASHTGQFSAGDNEDEEDEVVIKIISTPPDEYVSNLEQLEGCHPLLILAGGPPDNPEAFEFLQEQISTCQLSEEARSYSQWKTIHCR